MARKARVKSSTGIYHVLVRAISDLSLFSDSEDITTYLGILRSLQDKGLCTIYAYALFPTHIHLLIQDGTHSPSEETVGGLMKRLASSYSYYFNVKYDHYGPIYIDRFKSEPIEDLQTFVSCLNFITTQSTPSKGIITNEIPSFITNRLSLTASVSFIDFSPRKARITDSRLLEYLQRNFSYTTVDEFLQRPPEDIRTTILAAKSVGGSLHQITRLTGCSYKSVVYTR